MGGFAVYISTMTQKIIAAVIAGIVILSPFQLINASTTDWQRGASIQPSNTTEFGSDAMKQALVRLKNTGANYVSLIIPYYQANRESTDMRPGWNTPTDDALATAIDYAHSIGLHVMLKPHLETDYIEWRGNIDPPNRDAWFGSYDTMLLHYGAIAQAHGVEDYCIGTELLKMANPSYNSTNTGHWQKMIEDVRKIYSGKLTYSANWWGELDTIEFWPQLDYIGISAYYDLYHAQNSSVAEQMNSWDNWKKGVIEPIAQKFNKSVVFTEIGFRSIEGTYRNPWDWSRDGNYNEQDQANSYEALFSYWGNVSWMKGVELWRWEIFPPAAGSYDKGYTPQNKMAETTMTTFWGGTTATTTPTGEPGTLTISLPQDGGTVRGVTTFSAALTGKDLSSYKMYWQIEGDHPNEMRDNLTNGPHKEAIVRVNGWTWRGSGPYPITFTAKDSNGTVINQKQVSITVAH